MSTDYSEKERAFLDSLKADTGRDLGEWMAAISAQNLAHRNDIIDWLRQQGFMFSKASWLERIHHNGGRPIYAGQGPRKLVLAKTLAGPADAARTEAGGAAEPTPEIAPSPAAMEPADEKVAAKTRAGGEEDTDPAALDELLAKAKAYRPLAQYVLAEIARAVPSAVITPRGGYVEIREGEAPFAVLAISPRELRLGLALGPHPFDDVLRPAKPGQPGLKLPATISHFATLTDARQVNTGLLALVKSAAIHKD